MDNIITLFQDKRIFQSKLISSAQIRFGEDVVAACEKNYCGRYGSCWTCPPGIGTLNEIKKRFEKYPKAYVFTTLSTLKDSFDIDGMARARTETTALLYDVCAKLSEGGIDFVPLGCGSCDICKNCTYPSNPCRFPKKAIPAVEACGIDVVSLASDIGLNYNNGENTVTYFCIIFFKE